jgi:hypothetical protein
MHCFLIAAETLGLKRILLILILCLVYQGYGQSFQDLPPDFGYRAYERVKTLSGFGTRTAGSVAEQSTVEYVSEAFSNLLMSVEIDTFYYNSIQLKNRQIKINGKSFPIQTAYLQANLQDTITLRAEGYVVKTLGDTNLPIESKTVFSKTSNQVIKLKEYDPKAVFVVRNDDFAKVVQYHGKPVEVQISIRKKYQPQRSFNIVATFPDTNKQQDEIIITAHWDSQKGPGADDNASGTAVLLELASYFQPFASSLPYRLKFVALGAEEVGLIGSKAYILNHSGKLINCLLNINIDGVGRGKKVYIEMKRPLKFTEYDTSSSMELISTDNFQTNLLTSFLEVYRNSSSSAIYPKWLQRNIKTTMKELHYRYSKASCCSGADHRSFAYLDIPVVYLTIISKEKNKLRHSERDIPSREFVENLEKAGNIVRKLIIKTGEKETLYP